MNERQFRQHCWEFARGKFGELFGEFYGGDELPMHFAQAEVERLADAIGPVIDRLIWEGTVERILDEEVGATDRRPKFQQFLERVFQSSSPSAEQAKHTRR